MKENIEERFWNPFSWSSEKKMFQILMTSYYYATQQRKQGKNRVELPNKMYLKKNWTWPTKFPKPTLPVILSDAGQARKKLMNPPRPSRLNHGHGHVWHGYEHEHDPHAPHSSLGHPSLAKLYWNVIFYNN